MKMWKEIEVTAISADGLVLPGTLYAPVDKDFRDIALLIHGGGGGNRREGRLGSPGLYPRLSQQLREAGVASIRFDHRAFLALKNPEVTVTIAGIVNDIRAYITLAQKELKVEQIHLVGASFGGGATAIAAGDESANIASLVLFYPMLDYQARLLKEKPFWKNARLTPEGVNQLQKQGWLPHRKFLKMKPPLINEVAQMVAARTLGFVKVPTLIIHGTKDLQISHTKSQELLPHIEQGSLHLIEDAGHLFTVPHDEDFVDPQTLEWQTDVFLKTTHWITQNNPLFSI